MRRAKYVGLLLAVLFAAGTTVADDTKVTLRIKVPPKSLRGMQSAADRAVLDAFLARHPEIKVEPYVQLRIEGPRGEATLYMSMAGDTAPDALYVYGRSTQKYIDQEFLYPLNEYLHTDNETLNDEVFRKFLPAISRVVELDAYLKEFKIPNPEKFKKSIPDFLREGEDRIRLVYGIPAMAAVSGLMYRKDLFNAAGLDPEKPPTTWEELLEYSRRLTLPERGQFGIVLPGAQGASWRFANFVWQAGGRMCRRNEDGTWRLAVDEPEAVRALEFYKEMRWGKWKRDDKEMQGCMRVATSELMTHFLEGRAAMTIISTTGDIGRYLQTLDPSQVGLAPLPAGPVRPDGTRIKAAMLEGEFWGINAQIADDKPHHDATWKYIRFLISDEAKAIRTRTYVEAGWALSVNPKWLKQFGYETELRLMPKAWITLYDDLVKNTELEPYARAYAQVSTDVLSRIDEVLYDEHGDPAAVARGIARTANERFFSTTPPKVISRRRFWANGAFALLMAGVGVLLVWLGIRWHGRRQERLELESELLVGVMTPGKQKMRMRMEMMAWLFMIPAVLSVLIWKYYPLVRGAVLAFYDYRIIGESAFIWLDNFIEALCAPSFWRAFLQTIIYASLSLGLGFLMPIFLALMLSEIPRVKMLFRTVYYLPAITSGLVVMFIWKMMYDDSDQGIFNTGLKFLTTTGGGRTLVIVFLVCAWALVLSLLLGILLRIMHHYRGKSLWPPVILLVVVAPFWLHILRELLALGHFDAWAVARLPELGGLSTPIVFGLHGVMRALVVLLTAAAVLMWLRTGREPAESTGFLVAGAALVVMGAALGFRLNAILEPMQKPYPWLQDATGAWAMLWVIVPGIWARMGPGCIIYLAALKSIPEDLYEAADVDGAGPIEKAYHVTFQYLKPLIIINFVGAFVGTFHAMQNILVMTGGGPGDRTVTIGMDIFFNAFTHLKFGYATAEAWILGSLLIGFTLYQLRILKKLRFTRAEN